jgi:hypothetical protein
VIHILRERATEKQLEEMLQELGSYVKFAVDISQEVAAGGGELHADCEEVLLEQGSRQRDIWGADWIPASNQVTFEALINIRSAQDNPSMEILDDSIRHKVEKVIRRLVEGV